MNHKNKNTTTQTTLTSTFGPLKEGRQAFQQAWRVVALWQQSPFCSQAIIIFARQRAFLFFSALPLAEAEVRTSADLEFGLLRNDKSEKAESECVYKSYP